MEFLQERPKGGIQRGLGNQCMTDVVPLECMKDARHPPLSINDDISEYELGPSAPKTAK